MELEWIVLQTRNVKPSQLAEQTLATYAEAEPSAQHILIVLICLQSATLIHVMEKLNVSQEDQEALVYQKLIASSSQDAEMELATLAEPELSAKALLNVPTCQQSAALIHALEMLNVSQEDLEILV